MVLVYLPFPHFSTSFLILFASASSLPSSFSDSFFPPFPHFSDFFFFPVLNLIFLSYYLTYLFLSYLLYSYL